ncbi:hypothetical protein MRX96_049529 [Rhipicephalus microplus]
MLGSQFSDMSPDERCNLLRAHSSGVVVYYDSSLGNDSSESSEEASSAVMGDKNALRLLSVPKASFVDTPKPSAANLVCSYQAFFGYLLAILGLEGWRDLFLYL